MGNDEIRILGDALGDYIWEKHILPRLSLNLSFYKATVVAAPSQGKVTVRRPFSNPVTVRCAVTADNLSVGDHALVLVLGDASNAVCIGDAALRNLNLSNG